MTPVAKGARYRVLTGERRGLEGVVAGNCCDDDSCGWWLLTCGEGVVLNIHASDLDGSAFQRLSDAPAEVDPLFAEIDAMETARSETSGGAANDDRQCPSEWIGRASEELDRADGTMSNPDGGGDAEYRDAMMHAAKFCLAAVRCIDRAHRPT